MGRIQKIWRDGAASFVGFGRGVWLFPFDAIFRTVGLRYSWIKMLFAWTPAPLLARIGRPRIRYNVHDRGGVLNYGAARRILARFGYDLDALNSASEVHGPRGPLPWVRPNPLPFLWINGRSDATISVMGANIYPEDIEVVPYRDPELARRIHSFLLTVVADSQGTPRPSVALELTDDVGVNDEWRGSALGLRLRCRRTGWGLRRSLNLDGRRSLAAGPRLAALPRAAERRPVVVDDDDWGRGRSRGRRCRRQRGARWGPRPGSTRLVVCGRAELGPGGRLTTSCPAGNSA